VLRFAFEYARVPRLVSVCDVDNTASARVMAKLGMTEDTPHALSRSTNAKSWSP